MKAQHLDDRTLEVVEHAKRLLSDLVKGQNIESRIYEVRVEEDIDELLKRAHYCESAHGISRRLQQFFQVLLPSPPEERYQSIRDATLGAILRARLIMEATG